MARSPATPGAAAVDTNPLSQPFVEMGATGLRQFNGYVRTEWLRDLQGWRGIRVLKEMRDNDPIIGGIFLAIELVLRNISFRIEPADKNVPADVEAAAFVNSCIADMEQSWPDLVGEILTFLQYGWSVHETVFKTRKGRTRDPKTNSKYDDGLIGWRKFAARSQDTLLRWEFDESGDAVAMVQLIPTGSPLLTVPLARCLHFRTTSAKGSPEGRALDPETLIPTPDGWRRMDDLHVGSKVFDEAGRVRYVTARADWDDRPAYRVTFGDGTEIVADANHQWITQNIHERSRRQTARLRTTEEISQQVKTRHGSSNHGIAWGGALDYPEQLLPIDPYFLGLWLGDGTSMTADISCHADDVAETCELIGASGFTPNVVQNGRSDGNGRLIRVSGENKWSRTGPASLLTAAGLRGNKHVPSAYLRGSIDQRKALLAGLMDSDGHVDAWGRCEFTNTNYNLSASVAELVRSLGTGARMTSKRNSHSNTAWMVKFTPTWAPFRLARKIAKCRTERQRKYHYIAAVEPVSPRRTVCIEVDSPSHLFLAGESMVPTHNSLMRNAYTSWYYKKQIQQIEAVGIERDLAGLPVAWVPPKYLSSTASAEDRATLEMFKKMVRDTVRNEQEGFVLPLAYDQNNNKLFDFSLINSAGKRNFDTSGIINRYDLRIAMSMVADFIMLGHEKVGSFALSDNKTDLFEVAINAWLDVIASEFNRKAIPDLLEINGMEGSVQMQHADVSKSDLEQLGAFIEKTTRAGAITPDDGLEAHLRDEAGLPPQEEAGQRALNEGADASESGDEDPATDREEEPEREAA